MSSKKSKKLLSKLNYDQTPIADYVLAVVVLGLALFGILMVYDTSVVVAYEQFGDRLWFLKNQSMWAILGIAAGFVASDINYNIWRRFANPMLIVTLIMLVLVLIPGFSNEVYGARQRLVIPGNLPFMDNLFIQPSELAKLTLGIYLANLFVAFKERSKQIRLGFPNLQFVVVTSVAVGLIAIEPDLGNAILVASTAMILYFAGGAPLLYVVGIITFGALAALSYALSSDYRRDRILTFLNPMQDPQGSSYQITQVLIALGSGGLLGLGLGNSRQKYQYIPEVMTDSIFAIIGEELGYIGAMLVIAALFFIVWRGFKIAVLAKDEFGRLLAIMISSNIAIQAIVNLGGMVGLIPLTGVPLPFISYGGSSLTLLLVSIGILINISRSART